MRKIHWKPLLICLGIPLAVGALSAWLSAGNMRNFASIRQPPLAPPAWLFPVAWTVLYLLMGLASYLIVTANAPQKVKQNALFPYGLQLIVNFFWSPLFFNARAYLLAFIWLLLLWILILATLLRFRRIRPVAGWLLLPYLAWVTFAGYLNLGVYLLN